MTRMSRLRTEYRAASTVALRVSVAVLIISLVAFTATTVLSDAGTSTTVNGVDARLLAGRYFALATLSCFAGGFVFWAMSFAISRVRLGANRVLAPATFATPSAVLTDPPQMPALHSPRPESSMETMSRHASDATPAMVGFVGGTATVLGLLAGLEGNALSGLVIAGAAAGGQAVGCCLWFLFCELWVARWEKRNELSLLRLMSRRRRIRSTR